MGLMQCKSNPALLEKMLNQKGVTKASSNSLVPMVRKLNSDSNQVQSFFSSDFRPKVNYFEAVQHSRSSVANSEHSYHVSESSGKQLVIYR
jgi:hypothetical protein